MLGLETLIRWLAPYDCLVCGREGDLLCAVCCRTVIVRPAPVCCLCHRPAGRSFICHNCSAESGLSDIWLAARYQGSLKQLLHHYKFDRAKDACRMLAVILQSALPYPNPGLVISFVPTATSRVRQRGYDQAALLAGAYAGLLGRQPTELLHRVGQSRQVGASRQQRLQQMQAAYRLRRAAPVAQRNVLLIDDVITTGASLQTAAQVLLRAGAASVSALVVAQNQSD